MEIQFIEIQRFFSNIDGNFILMVILLQKMKDKNKVKRYKYEFIP